ncbi:hypothetical protein SDC9_167391 [bioreactor metagenome]|uniref:Uncharacterized protein n=1 Tax=bioreactor metagenome TaxID=1076179 RepID=A0A645G045_9ZZZZ
MLRVFTNYHDFALALNNLALLAHGLHGRSDFHVVYLLIACGLSTDGRAAASLLASPGDPAPGQVVW